MDILVQQITQANEAYRNGRPLLMTDEEYDSAVETLASKVPNHPLLKKIRAPPSNGLIVKMPYYLGSLDKAKTSEDLLRWNKKSDINSVFVVSEKLDGISGLLNPRRGFLYLSGDDTTGLDVSNWLPYISVSPRELNSGIPETLWIRGELIMPKENVPSGRLGRSIINGLFHQKTPNPEECSKVRFVAYEVIGSDSVLRVQEQIAWIQAKGFWSPWVSTMKDLSAVHLTELLETRRATTIYDIDGLVIKMDTPIVPRIVKGNPKDAIAWKPPTGETKLATVQQVEWNASASGRLVPRVVLSEPVHLGGSAIQYVSGVHARRIVDWKIGPKAVVVIRKGGDVIPVIDRVEVPAEVVFPPDGTWEWDCQSGAESDAVNIKQKLADSTTYAAQMMKIVTRLEWDNIGPAQIKAVVHAGYTTIPLLRTVTEPVLVKLLGPVKGSHLFKTVQSDGWKNATEIDLFVASPICPSGIGKTRLEALLKVESDMTQWSSKSLIAPKGWSVDALKEFQKIWKQYEVFRKTEWNFLRYPLQSSSLSEPPPSETPIRGTIVFSGFRDSDLEADLLKKGYRLADSVKSDTKYLFISDDKDPYTYTSTKIEKAKKIPGCSILRKKDWVNI